MLAMRQLNLSLAQQGQAQAAQAPPPVEVPNFIPLAWDRDGWCWAAVASMVHQCMSPQHVALPQCFWAQQLISSDCCAHPENCVATAPAMEDVLRLKQHLRDSRSRPLTFLEIQGEIPQLPQAGPRRPVVCGQFGHVVVLTTWGSDGRGNYVWYADPAPQGNGAPALTWALYDVFQRTTGGGWQVTFLTQ
jgi:hypothetical protein